MMRAQSINLCLWVQNTLFARNENTEYTKIWQLLVNFEMVRANMCLRSGQ